MKVHALSYHEALRSHPADQYEDLAAAVAGSARPHAPDFTAGGLVQDGDSVTVHWLQGTFPHERLVDLLVYLALGIGSDPVFLEWGRWRYARCAQWEHLGVYVYFDRSAEDAVRAHGGRACLVIPGSALDCLRPDGLARLLHDLVHSYWLRATRLDVAFDDRSRAVPISVVQSAAEAGNYTGFRRWKPDQPRRTYGCRNVLTGDMIRFGNRGREGSGKCLKIYDKLLESKGLYDCLRWELELSDQKAAAALLALAYAPDLPSFAGLLSGLLGGCISFVERVQGAHGHVCRMVPLPWWQAMQVKLGRAVIRGAKRERTFERAQDWVRKTVGPSLAMLQRGLGAAEMHDWLADTMRASQRRLTPRHEAVVEHWLLQNGRELGDWFGEVGGPSHVQV